MTVNAQSYLNAAYPPPLCKPRELPRLFLLRWKPKPRPRQRDDTGWHEAFGTLYPNGRVTLDFGGPYMSLSEMKETVRQSGECCVAFLNANGQIEEEDEENQGLASKRTGEQA